MKKKVDPRIRQLLENGVQNNHRSLLLLVGDKGRDQIVNLHYMLSKMTVQARPSVLWCYKKELGFSSNKKKRMKMIKKRVKQGLVDPNKEDPFDLFISSTTIRFAYYHESQKILGNTYGMCVLQDFEALTPNLLARTMETVSGGGLVILLINTMSSLRQLYSLTMDAHSRLRTEAHHNVVGRFNERFLLSVADCPAALVADDELNVLPISTHAAALSGGTSSKTYRTRTTAESPELAQLRESLSETQPIGPLVARAKTLDQANALLRFEEAISEKTLRSTVALTASRGRGKSAALGLAVSAAVAHGYSNIFVTSPSPENLRTFFAFLFVGFDALDYQEHTDYEIIQSTNPALNKAIVRVNVFRSHRQTVQYIAPTDASRYLAQAELLVIDEAAAIPLPVVQSMLGPYLVFLCSTVTGYEGTGRSLSLKLINQLRKNSVPGKVEGGGDLLGGRRGRVFREVTMSIPIRYGPGDPVEKWLYDLLCLEAGGVRQALTAGAPHPSQCELFYVERDALFSRHRASEAFLHRVMALFVSSHYKNSPNDLQMLSDAPAHMLFVLLGPTRPDTEKLPDVLVAIQVCLEGRISAETAKSSLSRGHSAAGDLIPWTLSQQFQDSDFATLSGARIVRVATHPDVQSMGYGTRAIQMLLEHFAAPSIVKLGDGSGGEEESDEEMEEATEAEVNGKKSNLRSEIIGPRKKIPPLLRRLAERKAERLDYMGVSYGLTQGLYKFWSKLGFVPLYMRLTTNDLTGEHTCIMLTTSVSRGKEENAKWLSDFHTDFRRRFVHLLAYAFRKLAPGLALSILEPGVGFGRAGETTSEKSLEKIKELFSPYDLRRLESYSNNLVDYHVVVDMLPKLAEMYTLRGFGAREDLHLSNAQSAVLMGLGLQHKTVDEMEKSLGIQASQVLALFNKVVRKISACIRKIEEGALAADVGPKDAEKAARDALPEGAVGMTLDEDLQEGVDKQKKKKEKKEEGALSKYAIQGDEKDWEAALPAAGRVDKTGTPNVVSVKVAERKVKKTPKKERSNGEEGRSSGRKKRKLSKNAR